MKRDGLHLEVDACVFEGRIRRTVRLHEDGVRRTQEIVYEHQSPSVPPGKTSGEETLDGAVLGFLFHAMQRGRPLFVHGALSRTALSNIEAFQGAWRCWRPDRYRQIDVTPERIADCSATKPDKKAIAAYSGGVDSTYTALRHKDYLPLISRHNVTSVLMVHGFDVALDRSDHFARLIERTQALRDHLGLDLRVVRTNSKELHAQDWQDSHAAQLAACLHLFSDEFAFGLIGSTKAYDSLVLPYGSSPVTDHLLSGDGFSIVHDGGEASRTEKVAVIARYPIAVRALKMCWEGPEPFRNCGVCEKCVRTWLNFAAVGVTNPSCFENWIDARQIHSIPVRNEPQAAELRSIVAYARRHDRRGDWLEALKARITVIRPEPKPLTLLRAVLRGLRINAVMALGAIGVKKPLKRLRDAYRR